VTRGDLALYVVLPLVAAGGVLSRRGARRGESRARVVLYWSGVAAMALATALALVGMAVLR
jgi:hypothetical protein